MPAPLARGGGWSLPPFDHLLCVSGPLALYLFFFNLLYFWLCWVFVAVHGLSLVAASRGYFVAVRGLLIAVASFVAGHGL